MAGDRPRGLVAGVADIAFIVVYYLLKNVPATRVLQGIAAGALGQNAPTKGGIATALLGLALHFVIALGAAAVVYVASRKLRWLVEKPSGSTSEIPRGKFRTSPALRAIAGLFYLAAMRRTCCF